MSQIRNILVAAGALALGACAVIPAVPTFAPAQAPVAVDAATHRPRPGHAVVVIRFDAGYAPESLRGSLDAPDGRLTPSRLRFDVPALGGAGGVVAWEVEVIPGRSILTIDRAYAAAPCEGARFGGRGGEHVGAARCNTRRQFLPATHALAIEAGRAYLYATLAGPAEEEGRLAPVEMGEQQANALRAMRADLIVPVAAAKPAARLAWSAAAQ